MNTEQHPLSGFERRLLAELKRVIVDERPGLRSTPAARAGKPRARFGSRPRLALASAVAAVAALALASGLPLDGGGNAPSAAYAVTANEDGTVSVEINSLRDAEGLERKLREAGVPAVVQYLPPGKACSDATFTLVTPGSGDGAIQMSEDGSLRFEIGKGALQPGQKLFIYTQQLAPGQQGGRPRQPASALGISFVKGVFAGCQVVEAADD